MATKKKAPVPKKKAPSKKKTFSKKALVRRGPQRGAGPEKKKKKVRRPAPVVAGRGRTTKRTAPPKATLTTAAAAAPAATPAPDPARPTALALAEAALDKKAEDVTVLDVRGLTSYADYFVVMTADSDRQAGAIADHLEQTMKAKGVSKVGVEGYEGGRWILVDYGDVVAHVMNRESRGFYDLEGLWADAPRFSVEG
jgi:ribosome-associated protein